MSETRYRISFAGEIAQGRNREEVKRNLARIFKIDSNKAEQLFTGNPVVIKNNADHATVLAHKRAFESAGAICRVEEQKVDSVPNPKVAVVKKVPPPSKPVEKMTCPKCGHDQEKADQCAKCGIFIEKYLKRESDALWGQEPRKAAMPGRKDATIEQRPTSVTVICWIAIAGSISAIISQITGTDSLQDPAVREMVMEIWGHFPVQDRFQGVLKFGGLLISMVCAVAMLNGLNWGRLLYTAGSIVAIAGLSLHAVSIWSVNAGWVPFLVSFFAFAIFVIVIINTYLYLPKANLYFSKKPRPKKK
jgi:rubrerythrin